MQNQTTWYPCNTHKQQQYFRIKSAKGSHISLENGQTLIDATSSWWCKTLGHNHPRLQQALQQQMQRFEHVMLPNTTHEVIEQLSTRLSQLMPHLSKTFYASDGACAVEIALKMSFQSRQHSEQQQRQHFLTLQNSYHGETLGALSVSNAQVFRRHFEPLLLKPTVIDVPYVTGPNDPLWHNADMEWQQIERQLAAYAETATALLIEPILQGAGGMRLYSQDFLSRLVTWAQQHDIHVIADEILTGLGRTGALLASEHANIQPDFICLSKGLTAGWMAMSAVITTDAIYDAFHDTDNPQLFIHSHTYAGNALAASVAVEALKIIEEEQLSQKVCNMQPLMMKNLRDVAKKTQKLHNLRGIGATVAADLYPHPQPAQRNEQICQIAAQHGALLRPLGNTLYWLPPLNIQEKTLNTLRDITTSTLQQFE